MINIIKNNKLPVIISAIYLVLLIMNPSKAYKAFDNSVYYLIEMVEILPVIFLLTVSIEVLIPKEWIIKRFGEGSGFVGNILSLVLGSISAGPIYAAFPICKMLLTKGASIGNVVIILSAWAVVKVPMLANEAKFLGPQFMAVRWVLTVVMIFAMGFIMNKVVSKENIPKDVVNTDKRLSINQDFCVGCGMCARLAPENYKMQQGKAVVIDEGRDDSNNEIIRKTVEKCPAKAITFNETVNCQSESEE